ncbi:50S ribosomal protein L25/general stress protein Ctc [Acinetobacter populi]|uniref:Large ribosomal subunit protein bL25 n=1 Tax=Acinetobacter populi TaxID=1582270 RepID=A0A1Z9YU68_9GAMM|nr:50S ribosomal protein L25/general stress protein Ctc [Acinetobacter populi]OUY05747.1 50S ribosomal protein L25/general stress protein Ctc [Acinetobacter populi]
MSNFVLNASVRDAAQEGKGASRRLRREAKVPAIIYGADQEPASITLELREVVKVLESEAFFSSIVEINLNGKKESVIIKALQRHPSKNTPLHADFLRVKAGEAITVNVPLHFANQEEAKGVKAGGVVSINAAEVEVSVLPADLPESITVDLADLDVGDVIHLSDIKLPKGVTLTALQGEGHDLTVASITVVKAEAAEEAAPEAAEEEDKGE